MSEILIASHYYTFLVLMIASGPAWLLQVQFIPGNGKEERIRTKKYGRLERAINS